MDFVLLWVDGNDEEWLTKLRQYKLDNDGDSRSVRFRDWDNLQYWFRSIVKYAPWVNKIHFVTEGHLPKWLNTASPKLNIVKHSDIIDEKYLPLFNSRAIEINLHKIDGLAEEFVYFNDDMFLTNYIAEEYFFQNHLPCDCKIYNAITPSNDLAITILRNMKIINKYFNKTNLFNAKLLNMKYGIKNNLRTSILNLWPSLLGFYDTHQPTPYLKTTYSTIWEREKKELEKTLDSKFKNDTNVNQYLFRYWQLASNNFIPKEINSMKMIPVLKQDDAIEAANCIKEQSYKLLCINDTSSIYNFEDAVKIVNRAFEEKFPVKSSFEI